MHKSILLVGRGSYLAQAILNAEDDGIAGRAVTVEGVPHDVDWSTLELGRFDAIVNLAYHPQYPREAYEESSDFDLYVARKAAAAGCHYVMMSTRRVYGPTAAQPAQESGPCAPDGHYGCNKLRTEAAVQALFGERCTILRVANVFGFEPGRHTFFGVALEGLRREGRITLDVSPFVKRDFLSVEEFARIVRHVLAVCPPGVFNLGSGRATEVGKIALWLIEGYGHGELLVNCHEERDGFELDRGKLAASLTTAGLPLGAPPEVRQRCLEIGARLRHEAERPGISPLHRRL